MNKAKRILLAMPICIIIMMSTRMNAQNVNSITATNGKISVWTAGSPTFTLGDSQLQDNGTGVGVGVAPLAGTKLNVNGDINMPNTSAFRLGNIPFLFNNNLPSCLFVGSNTGSTGFDNTFIGYLAGNLNSGFNNTYVGSNTGSNGSQITCYQNAAIGSYALNNTIAYGGSALGFRAAHDNTTGCSITAVGEDALTHNTTGNDNSALGHDAGETNETGNNNTFLGNASDVAFSNLSNATAIGANAVTANSNEMILGNNSVYVGIGYSGVVAFPPGKLSVDESAGEVKNPTIAGYFHNGDFQEDATFAFDKKGLYSVSDGLFTNHHGGWVLKNIGGDFEAGNAE